MNEIETNQGQAHLVEVGPRDGLQNEAMLLSVEQKVELIHRLVDAGVRDIEIGSFVHPRWIPQMADTDEVARRIEKREGVRYWALVPNLKGLERALDAGIEHVAVFMSSSESHNQKNLNRSMAQSLASVQETCGRALDAGAQVRAYLSTVFGCPFEGEVDFSTVLELTAQLLDFGAFQVSLGDTIGIGTPLQVRQGCTLALDRFGTEKIALHLHDTRGLAVANALVAFEVGVRVFDASVGGMGGCPYAPGAAGNLATEDLVNLWESIGAGSSVDLDEICRTSTWLESEVGLDLPSAYLRYWKSHHP
ncbi:MAG: hydroxymethylglutaryl-CoA lyase [Bradymonadaceae bacterium]